MNRFSLLVLLCCLALTGCARHYVLTMTNGTQVDAWGKPKLVNGSYHFKDAQGKDTSVSSSRVNSIMPASSRMEEPQPSFKPPPKKRHWYFLWLA